MQNFIDTTGDHIDLADEIIKELRSVYPNLRPKKSSIPFKSYHLLKDYLKIKPLQTIEIELSNRSVFVSFVHVEYSINLRRDGSNSSTELRTYVIVNLSKDFGHIFIKSESIVDKLREMFQPLEIDIKEDPEFSRKFLVLIKDKAKGMDLLNNQFCKIIKSSRIKGLQIEVLNHYLLLDFADSNQLDEVIKFGLSISDIRH